jgi:hypothetical protein
MRDFSPGLQKHLLRQIIRQVDVTATPPHQVTNPGLATLNQLSKSTAVAGACQGNH